MKKCFLVMVCLTCTVVHAAAPGDGTQERVAQIFQGSRLTGTIVVSDGHSDQIFSHEPERARTRFLPASTFKIPNTLIALETGVAGGPDFSLRPDPELAPPQPWWPASWNSNHTLQSALTNSVVWYYQELARRIGPQRMKRHLARFDYGNGDLSAGIDQFWLKGKFGISAEEQVEFLKRLYYGKLGLSARTTQIAKDLLVLESTGTYRLSGKTGWLNFENPAQPQLGWFVGYLETGDRVSFFAMNIDMAGPGDAKARVALTKAVLRELGALR